MGNVADCCSRTNGIISAQVATLRGSESKNRIDTPYVEGNVIDGPIILTPSKENVGKGGNRLLSASGSREDTHRKYVRMLEERRKNRDGDGELQPGWGMDDTDLIESTLYLDETTAYQGPLTDDETGQILSLCLSLGCVSIVAES